MHSYSVIVYEKDFKFCKNYMDVIMFTIKKLEFFNEKRILLQIINQILVLICDLLCLTGS